MPVEENAAVIAAPANYQEWLECFRILRQQPGQFRKLRELCSGAPIVDTYQQELYLHRLDETVTELLNGRIQRFLTRLGQLLEEGDLDGADLAAGRFCREVTQLFFFEELTWLPAGKRRSLARGYQEQLDRFWKQLVRTLCADADEHRSADLEELAQRMRRLSGIWRREET